MKNKGLDGEKLFIKTINSGAFYQKGDAISKTHCLEIKTTTKKSFRLSIDLLEKIWTESFDQNKLPMFGIILDRPNEKWMLKVDIIRKIK